ncbi:MAG: 3-methyl-2-oxobutanoate dehydrogenase subunit VorB [Fusobacteria bacterium]|nr:3-methyl-2-oxobutanoate dehydrogenase subunit VorB [Fusobacteriota bacterium]
MNKVLMKGNEAIALAAIKAGCKCFFGYPITPQNEIPAFMSEELPKINGSFVQAESEVAAINMVYGAGGCGVRVMTSSSSPGIALKQEGISYLAGAEIPCFIVSVGRGGPGLGGIQPAQSDYFQATRGGGNGDYKVPVVAPNSIQEAIDWTYKAFDMADEYRTPVMMLIDGLIGQMMEPVSFENQSCKEFDRSGWATTGTKGKRDPHIINSLYLEPRDLEIHCLKLQAKFDLIRQKEVAWEEHNLEGAEIVAVAYGITSRIVKNSIEKLKEKGIKMGLIRPITLNPFPVEAFSNLPRSVKSLISIEMSLGQMVEDVKLASCGKYPVDFFGRTGGVIPTPEEIVNYIEKLVKEGK